MPALPAGIRIQRLLAASGLASRRASEALLRAGRVTLNGKRALLGACASPADRIEVDGKPLASPPPPTVVLLNKPRGFVVTASDTHGRRTVFELLPPHVRALNLHTVGRLDLESRGALLLSNAGDLTAQLTHPRYNHTKVYEVALCAPPSAATLERWRRGVPLDGAISRPVEIRTLPAGGLELTMTEGKNRQIRRTAEALGHRVVDLRRRAIGGIELGALPEGAWRVLGKSEWAKLVVRPGGVPAPRAA